MWSVLADGAAEWPPFGFAADPCWLRWERNDDEMNIPHARRRANARVKSPIVHLHSTLATPHFALSSEGPALRRKMRYRVESDQPVDSSQCSNDGYTRVIEHAGNPQQIGVGKIQGRASQNSDGCGRRENRDSRTIGAFGEIGKAAANA